MFSWSQCTIYNMGVRRTRNFQVALVRYEESALFFVSFWNRLSLYAESSHPYDWCISSTIKSRFGSGGFEIVMNSNIEQIGCSRTRLFALKEPWVAEHAAPLRRLWMAPAQNEVYLRSTSSQALVLLPPVL